MENYEEKYKQALERCKKEFDFNNLAYSHEQLSKKLEHIFPELKESEDEMIRKEIISYLRGCYGAGSEEYLISKRKQWASWLEKQCEQKPTDKFKPKFKVGDWIISNDDSRLLRRIVTVDKIGYTTDCGYSSHYENYFHLWTIRDAKKGDILQADKCTLIFDSLTKDIDGNIVISSWYYCNTKTFYGMGTCKPALWVIDGVVPATKEQCDFLFAKMKEAGYKWDAEKKLIRYEQ